VRFIILMQFRISIATNCQVFTLCKNINYLVDHEGASSSSFQCILSILWLPIIFWSNIWCVAYYINEAVYDSIFVRVICGRWRYTSTTTHHYLIRLCTTRKGTRMTATTVNSSKADIRNSKTWRWTPNECYSRLLKHLYEYNLYFGLAEKETYW
jgi:hypothetical protein